MWFLGPALVFGLFPLLDMAIGLDRTNPPDSVLKFLEQDRYYRWCTYLFIPIQYAGLIFACWMWGSGDLALVESIGLALTMGVVGGIAINTAHELGHKRASSEKWLSRVALAQTAYGHFFIEHNRGHHVKVATPEDAASSRLGESFWAFLPRTVAGSLRSAWEIETARLDRLEERHFSRHNDILTAWAMTVVLFAALAIAFGPVVLPYLVVQAVIGFSLLEVVNYLEHYGLLRQKREDGRYERCLPEHSWNSNNVASNVLLYHLQRHSDHHANPTRRYQALRHVDEAPQLPTGYAGMIVLAWFPPLWRRVMDPRLIEHYGGDVTRANIQPRARRQILARYGSRAEAAS
jgi:alkane 1-monooxygenase